MKAKTASQKWIHAIALGGVLSTTVFAEEEIKLADRLADISRREELDLHLSAIEALDAEALTHRKLSPTFLDLMADDELSKTDRLRVFRLSQELSLAKEVIAQDDLAELLLSLEPKISSPNLKLQTVEMLLDFDAIKSTATTGKIAKLVQSIIADAAKELADQKYSATLHAACLETMDVSKASSSQISTLAELVAAEDTLSPSMRIALYGMVERLAAAKPSALKKNIKASMAKTLVAHLNSHPALSGAGASETELENLKALIPAVGSLLSDNDNSSQLATGSAALVKTLGHPDLSILVAGGRALAEIEDADLTKFKLKVESELLKAVKHGLKGEEGVARTKVILELLVDRLSALLANTKSKGIDVRIEALFNHFYQTAMGDPDFDLRTVAMEGFFALEPSLLEGENINKNTKKVIRTFIESCASAMSNEQFVSSFPQLLQRMGEVLHEITGRDYGNDGKLWSNWLRTEGKEIL